MTCPSFHRLIGLVAGDPHAVALWGEHVAECPSCGRRFGRMVAVLRLAGEFEVFRRAPGEWPPDQVGGRIRRVTERAYEEFLQPPDGCPDSAELARWLAAGADQSPESVVDWTPHIARCERCQAMVSRFAGTDRAECDVLATNDLSADGNRAADDALPPNLAAEVFASVNDAYLAAFALPPADDPEPAASPITGAPHGNAPVTLPPRGEPVARGGVRSRVAWGSAAAALVVVASLAVWQFRRVDDAPQPVEVAVQPLAPPATANIESTPGPTIPNPILPKDIADGPQPKPTPAAVPIDPTAAVTALQERVREWRPRVMAVASQFVPDRDDARRYATKLAAQAVAARRTGQRPEEQRYLRQLLAAASWGALTPVDEARCRLRLVHCQLEAGDVDGAVREYESVRTAIGNVERTNNRLTAERLAAALEQAGRPAQGAILLTAWRDELSADSAQRLVRMQAASVAQADQWLGTGDRSLLNKLRDWAGAPTPPSTSRASAR